MSRRAETTQLIFLTCFLIFIACVAAAQSQIKVPDLTGRIVDLTATLDANQQQMLEQKLRMFEQKKGTQIAVLIVPLIGDETIEQFSIRVAEQWKLGRKKSMTVQFWLSQKMNEGSVLKPAMVWKVRSMMPFQSASLMR
jgi:uncharacterized membrane protein YgcG